MGSIPGQGTKIPHAGKPKTKLKKKKSFYLKLTDKREQSENPCLLNLSFHLAEILVATMCT